MKNENISIKQVCEEYNVSRATVYNWMKKGLKTFVVGSSRRISRQELEVFKRNSEVKNER